MPASVQISSPVVVEDILVWPGQVVEIDEAEARRLVNSKLAQYADRAILPPRNAALRTRGPVLNKGSYQCR